MRKRLIILCFFIVFVLTSCTQAKVQVMNTNRVSFTYNQSAGDRVLSPVGYREVAQNNQLILFVEDSTSFIALGDKRSGKLWYSVSPDIDSDTEANENAKSGSKALLSFSYLEGQITQTINTAEEKFRLEKIDSGIKIVYSIDGFQIPLNLFLDGESLIADIDVSKVKLKNNCPLLEVSLLPNFGGAKNSENGYMLIPDGSGALMRFSEEAEKTGIYHAPIYGSDLTLAGRKKALQNIMVHLPVAGLKTGENAFFAIAEDGDAIASVNAVRAGTLNSFNNVYFSFNIFQKQSVYLSENDATFLTAIQKNKYQGHVRVRYAMLKTDEADYSGMARFYHAYLKQTLGLSALSNDYRMNLELLGAVKKEKSFLGITYQGTQTLTTYEQVVEISKGLLQNGVNLRIRMTGWANGGLDQSVAKKVRPVKQLGDIDLLKDYARKNKIQLFFNLSLLSVPQGSKNFNVYKDSARAIDNSIANLYQYDVVTGKTANTYPLLSLSCFTDTVNKLKENTKITGLSLEDLGNLLYTDYASAPNDNRQRTMLAHQNALAKLSGQFPLMFSGANAYALQKQSVLVNIPMKSSGSNLLDEDIPFYMMSLHGLVRLSGTPLNYSQNLQKDILKLAETGCEPFYSLMYESENKVVQTDYTFLFANHYDRYKENVTDVYKRLSGVLAEVSDKQMLFHQKVMENVYKITYEGNESVFVNYNETPVTVDSINIKGLDFVLKKGD